MTDVNKLPTVVGQSLVGFYNDPTYAPIFDLLIFTDEGNLKSVVHAGTFNSSCKAYLDEIVRKEITGEKTHYESLLNWNKKIGYWDSKEKPLLLGVKMYKGNNREENLVSLISFLQKPLGIKRAPRIVKTDHDSIIILHLSKKWVSSSYLFSFLTLMIRYSVYRYTGEGLLSILDKYKTEDVFIKLMAYVPYVHKAYNYWCEKGLPVNFELGKVSQRAHDEGILNYTNYLIAQKII